MRWVAKFWHKWVSRENKIQDPSAVDYYIYRSSSKIDMLWEQIDGTSSAKYSSELSLRLGVLEATGKAQPKELNVHDKLQLVLRHLEFNNQVGELGSGMPYVRGVMPMTWQEVDFYRGKAESRMVLFSGYAESGTPYACQHGATLVGLVGSAAYVTGMNDLETSTLGYAQPAFWARVMEELRAPPPEEFVQNLYDLDVEIDYQARRRTDGPPKQVLKFVAKSFLSDNGFLVGSPLYVAEVTPGDFCNMGNL